MAWDSKSAVSRRRQNSSASSSSKNLPIHTRQQSKSKPVIQPKSSHVEDKFLQDFLDPAFDPAAFLNASLPPLQTGSHSTSRANASAGAGAGQPVPLADLSNEAQTLISQLNAHTTRLSNTLTQLTDDILRGGSRLTYQVELLRGETLGFAETLNETLQNDIQKFLPAAEPVAEGGKKQEEAASGTTDQALLDKSVPETDSNAAAEKPAEDDNQDQDQGVDEPAYIKQLRTLTLVRERLNSVIKTFGDAMEFVFPPSELSAASGFLSVSAPEPGSGGMGAHGEKQQHSTEEKGQQILKQLREEIAQLLRGEGKAADGSAINDPIAGIERAAERVEQLKELAAVWKGTAEEKGRAKFIESLAKMVEDRHKELLKEAEAAAHREGVVGAVDAGGRPRKGSIRKESVKAEEDKTSGAGGYGLMSQLQKLRGGL